MPAEPLAEWHVTSCAVAAQVSRPEVIEGVVTAGGAWYAVVCGGGACTTAEVAAGAPVR